MMWLLVVLVSAALGSFANVLVHRLPLMILVDEPDINLAQPASHCPQCHAPIRWWCNIPLISFFMLRRRCLACGQAIAWRYFWIEFGCVCLGVFSFIYWGWTVQALAYALFLYVLWVLAWVDGISFLLPDVLTQSLLWLGLIYRAVFVPTQLSDAVFAVVFAYIVMNSVYWIYYAVFARQGLGMGDVKLLAAIGAWLGLSAVANVLIVACVLALLYVLMFKIINKGVWGRERVLAFGPFLAAAASIVLITAFDLGPWIGRYV